jgi:hypothetical protein
MSSNLAYALPRSPREAPEVQPQPGISIAPRVQRRARPKATYALVAVGGIFVIFLAQLLLSIALSDGAYKISDLTGRQSALVRTEGALNEKLLLAGSTQNLAASAQRLGMVASSSPVFLRLSDGKVIGEATAAGQGAAAGRSFVGNSLLAGAAAAESGKSFTGEASANAKVTKPPTTADSTDDLTGAPVTPTPDPQLPSNPGGLPSPLTH